MHGAVFNQLVLTVRIQPETPLLIKSRGDASILEPLLADMQFVRIHRNGQEEPFLPGSSVRGPLRSHAERLVRTVKAEQACSPVATGGQGVSSIPSSCARNVGRNADPAVAYQRSCYTCRLFGNTVIASRVRFSDFFADPERPVLLQYRTSVAIDRVLGTSMNPFDMEVASDGAFVGTITLRNFTLGQLGLLGAALLDLNDGIIALGFGKSRGLGRVRLTFNGRLRLLGPRAVQFSAGDLPGVELLADHNTRARYFPHLSGKATPSESRTLKVPFSLDRTGLGVEASLEHDQVVQLFELAAPLWVEEVGRRAG